MCTDPLIKYADISPAPRRIAGVSACVDDANIIPQRNMTIYEPFAQVAQGPLFGAGLLVRAKKDPYALVPTTTKPFTPRLPLSPSSHLSTAGRGPHGSSSEQPREMSSCSAGSPPSPWPFRWAELQVFWPFR